VSGLLRIVRSSARLGRSPPRSVQSSSGSSPRWLLWLLRSPRSHSTSSMHVKGEEDEDQIKVRALPPLAAVSLVLLAHARPLPPSSSLDRPSPTRRSAGSSSLSWRRTSTSRATTDCSRPACRSSGTRRSRRPTWRRSCATATRSTPSSVKHTSRVRPVQLHDEPLLGLLTPVPRS